MGDRIHHRSAPHHATRVAEPDADTRPVADVPGAATHDLRALMTAGGNQAMVAANDRSSSRALPDDLRRADELGSRESPHHAAPDYHGPEVPAGRRGEAAAGSRLVAQGGREVARGTDGEGRAVVAETTHEDTSRRAQLSHRDAVRVFSGPVTLNETRSEHGHRVQRGDAHDEDGATETLDEARVTTASRRDLNVGEGSTSSVTTTEAVADDGARRAVTETQDTRTTSVADLSRTSRRISVEEAQQYLDAADERWVRPHAEQRLTELEPHGKWTLSRARRADGGEVRCHPVTRTLRLPEAARDGGGRRRHDRRARCLRPRMPQA